MKFLFSLCLLFLISLEWKINAQGSSDPGLSTVGSLGILAGGYVQDTVSQKRNLMRLTQSAAIGENDVFIMTSFLDVYLQINSRIRFQIRGPIHMSRTKEARAVSIGDIFLIYSYTVLQMGKHQLITNAGVRLPTNQSNLTYENMVLPMHFQTSTGSFEAIISAQYIWQNRLGFLSATAGYQQPFFYINQNISPESRELHRKADMMLKADYLFKAGKKFYAGAGAWWLYHPKSDTRLNEDLQRIRIAGSSGCVLNLTAAAQWLLSDNIELGLTMVVPVINKDVRPDGLYRQFVLNPYFQLSF
jgi:hypothetical protein